MFGLKELEVVGQRGFQSRWLGHNEDFFLLLSPRFGVWEDGEGNCAWSFGITLLTVDGSDCIGCGEEMGMGIYVCVCVFMDIRGRVVDLEIVVPISIFPSVW